MKARRAGRAVDEAMQVEVLKRLGPPEKVAASYLPPRYLIGPELYPYFLTTLRIVLGVVAVLAALAIGASLGAGPDAPRNAVDLVARLFGGLLDALISAAGTVVLIFAIIQLVSPGFKPETKPQAWDPRKLMAEPDPQRVSIGGTIAEIVFTALALVVFNLYPQWIGLYAITENGLEYAALLSQAFFRYLPF
jgi:ABC-type antimicrobial peptide transport system permease subunit